jgi:hypothetical protein
MHGGSPLWQDLVTLAVVLAAAIYLARRWWPSMASLLGRGAGPSPSADGKPACGQGGGCKQCGAAGDAPSKDHRIIIVRPPRKQ